MIFKNKKHHLGVFCFVILMSMTNNLNFSKQLVKGKIAEMIFEQMLRDAGGFTVLGFGYEKVLPELARHQHDIEAERTMEIIRRAPDFAVIKQDDSKVYLIEVKFMRDKSDRKVLEAAQKMLSSWDPSYLFIATPEGFFMDAARTIITNNGKIETLKSETISKDLQENYLKLLNSFITS